MGLTGRGGRCGARSCGQQGQLGTPGGSAGQVERSALPLMGKAGEDYIDLAAAGEPVRTETQFFLNLLVNLSLASQFPSK